MDLANILIQLIFDKTEFWETAFEELAGLFIGDLSIIACRNQALLAQPTD